MCKIGGFKPISGMINHLLGYLIKPCAETAEIAEQGDLIVSSMQLESIDNHTIDYILVHGIDATIGLVTP